MSRPGGNLSAARTPSPDHEEQVGDVDNVVAGQVSRIRSDRPPAADHGEEVFDVDRAILIDVTRTNRRGIAFIGHAVVVGIGAGALGDVAGKGMQASVLMTTTQGFLRGVLMRTGNLRQAVSDLNAYLYPRCDGGRFISLWLGAIDAQLSTLEFVNAGHGHAWMHRLDGSFQQLNDAGGPLVGVADGIEYRSAIVPMSASERLVLLSDGILEQPHGQDREDDFGWANQSR